MKFGKRLAAEAARRWRPHYLDYKVVKKAIQDDVAALDVQGGNFEAAIASELQKINIFYIEREDSLEAMLHLLKANPAASIGSFRMEVADLRKFAVLNYIAVIKSVKKRNRHLATACAPSTVMPMRAVELLSQQYFFTSPKLAALATEAEILQKKQADGGLPSLASLDEYQCPICFEVLHNPVVLTCAHRFCWGCLVAHCATATAHSTPSPTSSPSLPLPGADGKDGSKLQYAADMVEAEPGGSTVKTYDCPVCRRAQILDLDRLQVDQHLTRFIAELKLRDAGTSEPMDVGLSAAEELEPPPESPLMPSPTPALERPVSTSIVESEQQAQVSTASSQLARRPTEPAVPVPLLACRGVLHNELPSPLPSPRDEPGVLTTAVEAEEPPLLPPQLPEHRGKLTVVLDMDGTLVSSFTPARAPRLPPGMHSYIVGRGARINPKGVFVVERPGLGEFFAKLGEFAEVVLFTAGVEDYAVPIADRLQEQYSCFAGRLYRPATVSCPLYPCIKDLGRLGRDLARTVLVDDTPLAFCRQPDNGIPVFNFRGDGDDRLLGEAVLPLLQSLAEAEDVRPRLRARFNMPHWFRAQGVSLPDTRSPASQPSTLGRKPSARVVKRPAAQPCARRGLLAADATQNGAPPGRLLLTDFDKTLTDCDAGERLVGELAPELAPMLAALSMPANFVPTTNAVLAEMQRRGISRDTILAELRRMGTEIPAASIAMLQWAAKNHVDVRIISDCNTVFISHMLAGAHASALVSEVITNFAAYRRVTAAQEGDDPTAMLQPVGAMEAASHRLVVLPRVAPSTPHACPLCPANLCKGQELQALRQGSAFAMVVYCGDGANDLCPALALGPEDHILARSGSALQKLIEQRAGGKGGAAVVACVHTWGNHAEMFRIVQELLG